MSKRAAASIAEHCSSIGDPRWREGVYPPVNVLVIGVCAVICGVDDFEQPAAHGLAPSGGSKRKAKPAGASPVPQDNEPCPAPKRPCGV